MGLWVVSGVLGGAVAAGPVSLAAPVVAAADDNPGSPARPMGRVVAKEGLVVRTGPSNRYRSVGSKRYGAVVGIVCQVNGQRVKGNPVWYKLSDASYAWSSERGIVSEGADPRWC
ncbi:hypothetical protein HEK616_57430 [Streptomyces nigrescens]|uniref:SH3b domain-containing protein n=1 Tax=Streptomyces nigrescens TaxID=1920 RepID=A0ABM8A0U9_STRNI|nr:hypothetical protein [Streptomyces nigrescens]BDM72256.1 hypothetical protein HEK616_57430 [Streptomyces nigrescens]